MNRQIVAVACMLSFIVGCEKTDAQKRREVKANLDNIQRAVQAYERANHPKLDDQGQPIEKQADPAP